MSEEAQGKTSSGPSGIERLASHRVKGILPRKYHMEYRSGQEELVEDKSLKEVEELILAAGEALELPESLLPENVERRLELLRRRKLRRRVFGAVLAVAAAVLLAVLICSL